MSNIDKHPSVYQGNFCGAQRNKDTLDTIVRFLGH